ncbi:MAG: tRNA lysidine(34) synthetase TilS [Halopseudomonas sp.]
MFIPMVFPPSFLTDQLCLADMAADGGDIWVAYSGGLDSRVLLQLALEAGLNAEGRLKAVHIDHGLQADAEGWVHHCRSVCDRLGIALQVHRVVVGSGDSLENQARIARYRVFESLLGEGDLLLQGHHADDQAETLLLRLMRGSGARGLASIPQARSLGRGCLFRPLLGHTRQQLERYAADSGLSWIEDPTNADTVYDRNFLRAQVLPALKQRWPAAAMSIGRSARHSADALKLCEELAAIDLQCCQRADGGLSVESLAELSNHRRNNLLRYWLHMLAGVLADAARLQRLWVEVALAQADAQPAMQFGVFWLRRFESELYLLPEQPMLDTEQIWNWVVESRRELQLPGGRLRAELRIGQGLALPESGLFRVGHRRGGERIRLPGRNGSQSLKKLLQQSRIAPWRRQQLPLLYDQERLVAVADLWIAEGCLAGPEQPGVELDWTPLDASAAKPSDNDF